MQNEQFQTSETLDGSARDSYVIYRKMEHLSPDFKSPSRNYPL